MKTINIFLVLCAACLGMVSQPVNAQTKAQKSAQIESLLNSKKFTFVAESANPMSGGNIRLTSSNYEMRFLKDSLNSFLPYFGVAFRAPFGSTESPLHFSSSDFTYEVSRSKKGGQTITVKINKPNDPDQIRLSVSPSGYGTLQISSINRQPISFYGVIEPIKEGRN